MKIWHVGAYYSPQKVDGVNSTVWNIAREQACSGHEVTLILRHIPDQAALDLAEDSQINLLHVPLRMLRFESKAIQLALHTYAPDAVHLHSVFIPAHAILARMLVQRQIPYVVTPNGGISPHILKRGFIKKSIYSFLLERPQFNNANAIAIVTPREEQDIVSYVPNYQGIIQWIPNPVDVSFFEGYHWTKNVFKPSIVYLGRFDVLHKGIDILLEIADMVPEAEFHLFGTQDRKTKTWLASMKRDLSPNIHFHNPIFGDEKREILSSATMYIQTSRWEAFGISIAEAMTLGVPCAVTHTVNLSDLFQQNDLGLVLSTEPKVAASQLKTALSNSLSLQKWSAKGREFAQQNFNAQKVASDYLTLYQNILDRRAVEVPQS